MTISHDALDLTVQPPRYRALSPPLVTSSDKDWRPVQTSSLENPPPPGADIWWLATEARTVGNRHLTVMLSCYRLQM